MADCSHHHDDSHYYYNTAMRRVLLADKNKNNDMAFSAVYFSRSSSISSLVDMSILLRHIPQPMIS
jgi:hypothetical protein